LEKKAVGRPGLQYLKQVARNTGADSYRAMERMACNKSRLKATNQSKDRGIRRRCNPPHENRIGTHVQVWNTLKPKLFPLCCA
jgi:hypothetical protein